MDFEKLFENIELTDEQAAGFDQFLEEYTQNVKKKVMLNESKKFKDKEKAILEQAEKGFELFEQDCEKAFELARKDTERMYMENMVQALEECYPVLEEKAKKAWLESAEYKAFESIKNTLQPVLNDDTKAIMEELNKLKQKEAIMESEKIKLEREKTINVLMEGIPDKYNKSVRKFISEAKNNDEIYERFQVIAETILTDGDIPAGVKNKIKNRKAPVVEGKKWVRKTSVINEGVKIKPKTATTKPQPKKPGIKRKTVAMNEDVIDLGVSKVKSKTDNKAPQREKFAKFSPQMRKNLQRVFHA